VCRVKVCSLTTARVIPGLSRVERIEFMQQAAWSTPGEVLSKACVPFLILI
jgi:hypothetical protein